jgi:hypothetical protein
MGRNRPVYCGVSNLVRPILAAFAVAMRASLASGQLLPTPASATGSMTADRARLQQISARDSVPPVADGLTARALNPLVRIVHNSRIPYSGNDGPLWAGRGLSTSTTGGIAFAYRREAVALDVVIAPTLLYVSNRPFTILAGREPGRSPFSSPWHIGRSSADIPLRFGDLPLRQLSTGESSVTATIGSVAFGATSASEWWGPAIRNTLLLSNNAAGIPRGFVRSARPLRSRFGILDARGFAGILTESRFFDTLSTNQFRSVSGVLVTYTPPFDTTLTVGLSRLVNVPVTGRGPERALPHALDVLTVWERVGVPGDTSSDGRPLQRADQLFGLSFRWVFPESGFETFGEWARMENPRSLHEWLVAPQHTQGYTLGLQWVGKPSWREGRARLQTEMTYVEQTRVFDDRPPPDFYTGRATTHGWTNEGQVLGAAIGPGSSAQFFALDWIAPRWQFGAFAGRTRWENDALYRQPAPKPTQHDVTVYSGVRGGVRLPWVYDVAGELTFGRRLNYLFQNDAYHPSERFGIDVENVTFALMLSPR